jgi:hypothetical protein
LKKDDEEDEAPAPSEDWDDFESQADYKQVNDV